MRGLRRDQIFLQRLDEGRVDVAAEARRFGKRQRARLDRHPADDRVRDVLGVPVEVGVDDVGLRGDDVGRRGQGQVRFEHAADHAAHVGGVGDVGDADRS